jgi:putative spermidine/putrescine transport system permease protein
VNRNGSFSIVFHTIFTTFMLAPILIVAWMSFTPDELLNLPLWNFSLRWYTALLEERAFINSLWVSTLLALGAATAATVLAVPVGYATARFTFPGRGAVEAIFMSPLIIPHVVLGVALLRFFTQGGLSGAWTGLFAAHVVVIFPYALRLIIAGFTRMDKQTENAAISLGATRVQVFFRIVLPVVFPSLAGGWLIAFIQSFDEVTMTVFIATPSATTLPVELYHSVEDSITPLVTSISTIVIVLTYGVLFLMDRIYSLDRILISRG